jgi:hypothetical protein
MLILDAVLLRPGKVLTSSLFRQAGIQMNIDQSSTHLQTAHRAFDAFHCTNSHQPTTQTTKAREISKRHTDRPQSSKAQADVQLG